MEDSSDSNQEPTFITAQRDLLKHWADGLVALSESYREGMELSIRSWEDAHPSLDGPEHPWLENAVGVPHVPHWKEHFGSVASWSCQFTVEYQVGTRPPDIERVRAKMLDELRLQFGDAIVSVSLTDASDVM